MTEIKAQVCCVHDMCVHVHSHVAGQEMYQETYQDATICVSTVAALILVVMDVYLTQARLSFNFRSTCRH